MSEEKKEEHTENNRQQKNEVCQKCDEYKNGWKRALADYDNLKKDLAFERGRIRASERDELALRLVTVLDSFDKALAHEPKEAKEQLKSWLQGILHIKTQIEEVMKGLDVERYGSIGDVFDSNVHDAVGQVVDEKKKDQEIVEIVECGWQTPFRVIRPAKVIINNIQNK